MIGGGSLAQLLISHEMEILLHPSIYHVPTAVCQATSCMCVKKPRLKSCRRWLQLVRGRTRDLNLGLPD